MTDIERANTGKRSRRTWKVVIAVALLVASGFALASRMWSPRWLGSPLGWFHASDSGYTVSNSPYKNIVPTVKYVGDEACLKCHAEIGQSYQGHPMGRSLVSAEKGASPDVTTVSFEARGLEYSVERRGDRTFHKETRKNLDGKVVSEVEAEARFAVGSGEQGVAFLLQRGDGYLFESPITWYSLKQKWDLSPGYEKDNLHLERFIRPTCLFCHSNQFNHVEGTENRYREPVFQGHAIGCERCHGPGELHVRTPELTTDGTHNIVNPADLEPVLRDSVCQQCHLQGDIRIVRAGKKLSDFRPGLPLWAIESVFVNRENIAKTRFFGQTEQMRESRCYRASAGELGCISCHDPHQLPAPSEKPGYYRDRCMSCHEKKGCALPLPERTVGGRDDGCINCHMPRSPNEQVSHAATTLHQIVRFKDQPSEPTATEPPPIAGEVPLVHFHGDQLGSQDQSWASRDLGIALATNRQAIPGKTAREVSEIALPVIEKSLEDDPTDAPAWEAKGTVLWHLGRRQDSLAAFRTALKLNPNNEGTLVATGTRAAQMSQRDEALEDFRRAIAINPWRSDYHQVVALMHFEKHEWDKAIEAARTSLSLNPSGPSARMVLIQCLLKKNQRALAEREFHTLLEHGPPNRDALEGWFAGLESTR